MQSRSISVCFWCRCQFRAIHVHVVDHAAAQDCTVVASSEKAHGMCCSPPVHALGFLLEAAFSPERQLST